MAQITKITIGIIDNHSMTCEGFALIISNLSPLFEVTFKTQYIADIKLPRYANAMPQLLIIDADLAQKDNYKTLEWLSTHHSSVKIIGLSANYPPNSKGELANAGCIGYLYTDDSDVVLLKALNDAVETGNISNSRSSTIKEFKNTLHNDKPVGYNLKLIQLICAGKSYNEIGKILNKSPRTINRHVSDLFDLYKVANRKELTYLAFKLNWVNKDELE